jgi:hypothetical protein
LYKPGFPLTPNSERERGKVNKLCLFTLGETFRQNFIKNEVFNLGFRETETWLRSKIAPRNQAINIVGTLDKIFRARLISLACLPWGKYRNSLRENPKIINKVNHLLK